MKKFLLLGFLLALLPVNKISAQTETNISVAPAILDIAVNPGEELAKTLFIQNTGNFAMPISLEVQSLLRLNDTFIQQDIYQYDAADWVTFGQETYVVEQGSQIELPYRINIPDIASAGGHYAQISLRGLQLEPAGGQASSIIVPEVVVPILITVSGEINESIEIINQNLIPLQSTPNSERNIEAVIKNTGNVHGLVSPELVIEKDGVEYLTKFAPRVILPNSETTFSENWIAPSDYGSYSSHLRVRYGNEAKTITSDKERFYISPPISILLLTAIFTWLGIYTILHRRRLRPALDALIGKSH